MTRVDNVNMMLVVVGGLEVEAGGTTGRRSGGLGGVGNSIGTLDTSLGFGGGRMLVALGGKDGGKAAHGKQGRDEVVNSSMMRRGVRRRGATTATATKRDD